MRSTHSRTLWPWLAAALLLGSGAGVLDIGAREVQGPLLVLMASAFVIAIPRRAPPWAIAVATWLGLPLAHVLASLSGADGVSFGMIIALPPMLLASYAGAFAGRMIDSSAATVPRDALGSAERVVWYRRPAESTLLLLAALATCALIGAIPVYATLIARAQPVAWWVATWWQIATFIGWVALVPVLLRLRRRLPSDEGAITPAEIATHFGIVIAGGALHAAVIVALTRLLFVPLGTASFGTAVGWAFTAYFPLDALAYALVIALAHASDRDRRERHAREELQRARLTALESQIRPHFLFNALNAAVVLAKRGSAEQTATVLTGLAELLRYVLDDASSMVRLEDELAFVGRYLAIEQVRLGDRLRWRVDASAEARRTLVPRLVLQPLVENAVQHGIGRQLRGGEIVISARCDGETCRLTVEDDGPGPAAGVTGPGGIGLANTRARLATLYPGLGAVELRSRPGGGCVGEVTLPRTTEPEARSA